MTQEEKELLFSDLCARLPYRPLISAPSFSKTPVFLKGIKITDDGYSDYQIYVEGVGDLFVSAEDIKPYLRPMDSMVDEERDEFEDTLEYDRSYYYTISTPTIKTVDWLLKNHFDYRRLIEKGLALEALDDMYYDN